MFRRMIFTFSLILLLGLASVSSADLVAYWDFEGDFGDTVGNNDAASHGDTDIVLDPERSRVAELDGTGDYIEIPNSASLNITGNEITVAAWVYFDDVGGPPEIVMAKVFRENQHTSPYFSYGLHILTNGTPRFWLVTNNAAGNARGSTNLQSGRWYHMAGIYNGSQMILYIDGEVAATTNKSGNITGYDTVLRLGTNGGLTEQMDGKLDDVRIYNHALDQVEIQAVMAQIGGGYPYAMAPSPKNGAIYEDTWVNLSWKPGDTAVSHDVYIGDNFDDVNDGAESTFRGNQVATFLVVGFPGFPFPDGLVPGTTYYWRIDEVNDTEPNSPWKGDIWSFSIPPRTAYNPDQADGAEVVSPAVMLSWTAGFGSKLHTVYFGDNFDDVNNDAGGFPQGATTYTPGSLKLAETYYWRVDEFDGIDTYKGDVWSFTTEGAVGNPNPSKGAVDVEQTPVLTWTPGVYAASHQIYFGTDKEAVKNADTGSPEYKGSGNLGSESYDPGKLSWYTTYYWRIDEANNVNPDSPWTGNVWNFTTADSIVIEDFEDYNDFPPDEIFNTWIDGYGTTTNGSTAGYAEPDWNAGEHYVETTIVHGGSQSMPLFYDNNFKYSEATMTLVSVRDWTEEGVGVMSLWFYGDASNAAERMYVALNGSAVVYHSNPDAVLIEEWTEWIIDLQEFAAQGVNLANVNTISIGFGDKNNLQAGGSGIVLFDDIRLYRLTP